MKPFFVLTLTCMLALGAFDAAYARPPAHGFPVECTPAIGANLSALPSQLTCRFSEPLEAPNALVVVAPNNKRIDHNDSTLQADQVTVTVTLDNSNPAPGLYAVWWSVTSVSDHAITSSGFQIGVNTPVPATPTPFFPPTAAPNAPSSLNLEFIPRFLIVLGIVVLAALIYLLWRNRHEVKENFGDE
jgi:methionine-rich copper-binding protein CopC